MSQIVTDSKLISNIALRMKANSRAVLSFFSLFVCPFHLN